MMKLEAAAAILGNSCWTGAELPGTEGGDGIDVTTRSPLVQSLCGCCRVAMEGLNSPAAFTAAGVSEGGAG
ncbi:hypothetical protein INR49_014908 [Caranx melampygus]|nr:hypothetical protein INR49_014908 [Caranx melampygus]